MKRIAVVEDNADNRLLVEAILGDRYQLAQYETGKEALDGLKKDRPDLVLLDISLPEMDGTQVIKRIRADADLKTLPVIALTAHAMAGDREKYLLYGFDDYLTKPIIDEKQLIQTIEKLMNRS